MCQKSFQEKHGTTCWELRSICLKVDKTSVEFTVLFQVKVKRQTDQLLDHKKNPLECRKKSLKRLDKWLKHNFRYTVIAFRQNVRGSEKLLAIR